jgi:RHS repeat-associated protein
LSGTLYNAASQPTRLTFASSDTDNFTYDPNTNRMTQYKFNVNGQSVVGNLTWNPNGTLASLAITDPFNSANAQACNYSHDDCTRIASVNCGASTWQQNFSYDSFGNITKTVPTGGTGYSFQPSYSTATNRMTAIPVGGSTPSYDANGNVLNDFLHSYTWDVYGRPIAIDGVSVTYDALGRTVEQNRSGAYSEIVYAPSGTKIEIMSGQSFTKAFVPLPGGAVAVYGGGIVYYRHPDHLGSSRFASTGSRTMYYDGAYAPFGEPYAQTGTTDLSFTGMNQDTVSNLYDFPAREYGTQGRWASPDPAGLAATDLTDPQSWNRFSYVRNSPINLIDPSGLCYYGIGPVTLADSTTPGLIFDSAPCSGLQPWLTITNFACIYSGTCSSGSGSNGTSGGSGGGNTSGSTIKSVLRKIGSYIPVVCGGGLFNYGGVRVSGGVASVSVNQIRIADSRTGYSEGPFTDLTFGEAIQGGVGYATFTGGGSETFLFAGAGGDVGVVKAGVSLFASHGSGDSVLHNSFGINGDAGIPYLGGGVGVYVNTDSLTSCVDHGFH